MNFDDLVEKKLVLTRSHPTLPISLYKYHRKVFYKGLFTEDERLRWARGIVLDHDGNIVLRPFYKWYNYHENGAGEDWLDTDSVTAVQKINGFMMSVTAYDGQLVYSSTGTFDSEYVELGRRYIENQCGLTAAWLEGMGAPNGATLVFEICAKEDPHIIDEKIGVYLIGIQRNDADNYTGFYYNDSWNQHFLVKNIAQEIGAYWADYCTMDFGDLKKLLPDVMHEGFMVYNDGNPNVSEPVIKLKSPYYLATKLLARHSLHKDHKVKFGKLHNNIDEEYYPLLKHLKNYPDFFNLKEQDRIQYIRSYFGDQSCN